MPVLDLMSGFIVELRNAGLPVSLTENLDAMEAVKEIPIEDRDAFKYALAATLVKSQNHWRAFETIFEVYFSLRGPEYSIAQDGNENEEMWREENDTIEEKPASGQDLRSVGINPAGMEADIETGQEIAGMTPAAPGTPGATPGAPMPANPGGAAPGGAPAAPA